MDPLIPTKPFYCTSQCIVDGFRRLATITGVLESCLIMKLSGHTNFTSFAMALPASKAVIQIAPNQDFMAIVCTIQLQTVTQQAWIFQKKKKSQINRKHTLINRSSLLSKINSMFSDAYVSRCCAHSFHGSKSVTNARLTAASNAIQWYIHTSLSVPLQRHTFASQSLTYKPIL